MPHTVPGLTHTAILDASPIPTSVVDASGTVVYVNDAFLAYASLVQGREIQREERVGADARVFITEKGTYDHQEWIGFYDRVLQDGEAVFLEEVCRRPAPDQERYEDIKMNPIWGEDGRVIAAVLT